MMNISQESHINQFNLCQYAAEGMFDKFVYMCGYLDKEGKNEQYKLDICGPIPSGKYDGYEDNDDEFIFRHICEKGYIKILEFLLKKYPYIFDITVRDYEAVFFACCNGHIEIVKCLCEHFTYQIDMDTINELNELTLQICEAGHIDVVRYIFDNFKQEVEDFIFGSFIRACSFERIEVINYFIVWRIDELFDNMMDFNYKEDAKYAIWYLCEMGLTLEYYLFIKKLKKMNIEIHDEFNTSDELLEMKKCVCEEIEKKTFF